MILVDTNVLLRAAQPGHAHHAAAKTAVKTLRLRGYVPCVVPQVLYEYWVVATRPLTENGLGLTTGEAQDDLAQIMEQFHFFRDERAIFERWQQLVTDYDVRGKTAHDARLVAAMMRHGITDLVTFNDEHFRRFSAITAVHPDHVAYLVSR